jgi:hypothetical protein
MGEAVGPETLHPAALVINADQQVTAQRLDRATQPGQLLTILPVAAKQDDTTNQWVHESLPVNFAQTQGCNVDDEGRVLCHGKSR